MNTPINNADYDKVRAEYNWSAPERFNFAGDVIDKWATDENRMAIRWVDDNDNLSNTPGPDGQPDSCNGGIYDATDGGVVNFNTIIDDVAANGGGTNGLNVSANPFAPDPVNDPPLFGGTNFSLVPGEGYFVEVTAAYPGGNWAPPHF